MPEDTVDIVLHGPACRHWVEPEKTSDYVVLALVEEPRSSPGFLPGGGSDWRCPVCGEVVLEIYDHGEMEYGVG